MNEIIDYFAESLIPNEAADAIIDCSELTLDTILSCLSDSGGMQALSAFPCIKWAVAMGKATISVRNAFSIKKQLVFFQTVKEGNPNPVEIQKRIQAARNREKWFVNEVEHILVYLERQTSIYKSKIQAHIYLDYITGTIRYAQYIEYTDILDQLFLTDITQINEVYHLELEEEAERKEIEEYKKTLKPGEIAIKGWAHAFIYERARCSRLISLGIIENDILYADKNKNELILTSQGKYFAKMLTAMGFRTLFQANKDDDIL